MKRKLLAIALATVSAGALAQPAREPSAEAMGLARELAPGRVLIFDVGTIEEIRGWLEHSLLNSIWAPRGLPCDRNHPECAAAARTIAAQAAPIIHARRSAWVERTYALYFDRYMTPAEIRSARAFVATPSGRKLASALSDLTGLRAESGGIDEIMDTAMVEYGRLNATGGLQDEFYDRTAHLPRMTPPRLPRPIAPPAPPAPPRQPTSPEN